MDSALSSTVNDVLSVRQNSTIVDLSNSVATDAMADRGISTLDRFSAAEMDFEARNWKPAGATFQNSSKHKNKERVAELPSQQELSQQAKESYIAAKNRTSNEHVPVVVGVLSKIEAFMKVGYVAIRTAPESIGLAWMGIRLCMRSMEDDFTTFNLFCGAASDIIGILISY